MALRSLVKISSVNNLSVARYVSGMGVELLGFDVDPSSSDCITPEAFAAITGWLSGVKIVGEIQYANPNLISELKERYAIDYLQFRDIDSIDSISKLPMPFIVKIDTPEKDHIKSILERYSTNASWFLVEMQHSLTPEMINWISLQADTYPIILGNNIEPQSIEELFESGFSGFALPGGEEIKPGYKDFDQLADILEMLEIDDQEV